MGENPLPFSPLLKGVRSKIDRAHAHFNDLHTGIHDRLSAAQNGKPIMPVSEVDEQRHQVILRHPKAEPLDPVLPMIVGTAFTIFDPLSIIWCFSLSLLF